MRKNPLSNMSSHGGIITSEFLENIRVEKVANPLVQADSFSVFNGVAPKDKRELDRQIEASFQRLVERWDALSNRYLRMNISEARNKWMIPLLKELGFDPGFNREEILVDKDDKLRFRLSHRAWISEKAPMLHMVAPSQDLEEAGDGAEGEVVRRGRSRSPHDEMQTYLNVTKGSKWGIVTNGVLLRILREYYHTTTKGYVEFDIENVFRERSFTDFRAMYRMVHASRFMPDKDCVCPLEQFYKESVAAGVTVGENLRRNVKKAIEALGNGFLTPELTKKLIDDEEFCKVYYSELLRVVYRLLFLLYAEQRAMLPTRDSIYSEEYSVTRLREIAETRRGKDDHFDLWEGLKVTFQMLKKGCPPLKVFGYNGSLFDDAELSILSQQQCKNEDILEAIRNLTLVEEERVLKRINYLDLGVEEIGSIYESLLDFAPRVFEKEQEIDEENVSANTFFLDPRGVARKSSGSYYTNPRLIDELIKSALKPVVENKLAKVTDKQNALLSVKVCDPACGSGAFLIAANNFLARELAKLRTGQAEPSDKETKKATRDVLQHCIYGVDLNPMAAELAKVSLWINSCVEDMPLNFLDHHIKCGNSLIGANPELIRKGIPDETFIPLEDEDKEFAKRVRFQNSMQHKDRLMVEFGQVEPKKEAVEYASLDGFAENRTNEVEEKKRKYLTIMSSPELKKQNDAADFWVAAFFWSLSKEAPTPPTQGILRLVQSKGIESIDPKTLANVKELAVKYRFFHWYLEFPDIFESNVKGFDCLLGNPPWDTVEADPDEFFGFNSNGFSLLNSKEKQEKIKELCTSSSTDEEWSKYKKNFKLMAKYFKNSGSFQHQGTGHINAFKLFLERFYQLVSDKERIGILVPSGFYTDEGCTELRKLFFERTKVEELYCFENKQKIFPICNTFKFVILVAEKGQKTDQFTTGFMLHDLDILPTLKNNGLRISLDLVKKFSPTLSVMEFQDQKEIDLLEKIFLNLPLLGEKLEGKWNAEFHRDLNHSEDHELLKTISTGIPIYEGKMIHQYDHLYEKATFWISEQDATKFYSRRKYPDPEWKYYRLAYRCVGMSTNAVTLICTILPRNAATLLSLRVIQLFDFDENGNVSSCRIKPSEQLFLAALMNSFVVNYVVRRKVTFNLSTFYMYQLPIPRLTRGNWFFEQIVSRAARLVCTDALFGDFWEEVYLPEWNNLSSLQNGYTGKITDWVKLTRTWTEQCGIRGWDNTKHDVGDRAQIRNEIEALVACLYGLQEEDLKYILSTFPIVQERSPCLIEGVLTEFKDLLQNLKT